MGGDHGPHVTVPAALAFQAREPEVDLVLVGLPEALNAELGTHGARPRAASSASSAGWAPTSTIATSSARSRNASAAGTVTRGP